MLRLPATFRFALVAVFIVVAIPGVALAQGDSAIVVIDPHTRAVGTNSSVVYLTFENRGAVDDRLIGASSAVAQKVEVSHYVREGDTMRLERPSEVAVPAGGSVEFKRGGLHLKLTGLTKPFEAGKSFPMNFEFARAGTVEAQVAVRASATRKAPPKRRRREGMY